MESTTTTTTPTSRNLPHVLTCSVIPLLVEGLDASNVLECYYVTRRTVLHGLGNNTITITIFKAALGLRHHLQQENTAASSTTRRKIRPLEFTLEYGSMKEPANLQHESLPVVVYQTNVNDNHQEPVSVSWENEAKVYYSQQISSEEYPTANFLASVSGAA
jgi:hypothetical protein